MPDPVQFLVGQTSYTDTGLLSGLAMGGSGPKTSTPTPLFTTSFSYDRIERPTGISATEGSTTLYSQTATYDHVGNVLGRSTVVPTQSGGSATENEAFCYDALNRLVWAGNTGTPSGGDHCMSAPSSSGMGGYLQAYSYDTLDRLTSGPAGSYTYGDSTHPHAVTGLSTIANQYATYDAMGNLTCRNSDTTSGHTCAGSSPSGAVMSYDNEGRLSRWTAPSGTNASEHFLYDTEGNLVLTRTTTASGTTSTIEFGLTETVLTSTSTTTTNYYFVAGQRVAEQVGSTFSYLVPNLEGSPTVALDSTGHVSAVQLFLPYGAQGFAWGTMPTAHSYTDQLLDSQMGLLYYGARFYDPLSAQFTSADIVQGNPSGWDPYAYVGGNPETFVDPTGWHAADICEENPEACDEDANGNQVQGSQGSYRPPSSGAPPEQGSIPAGAVVIDPPPPLDVTIGDLHYTYNPEYQTITVQGPDGPEYLTPSDGEAYYHALNEIMQEVNASADMGDQAATPQQGLEGGDTGGEPTTIDTNGASDSGDSSGSSSSSDDSSSSSGNARPVNTRGEPYPTMIDPRTGSQVPFPEGNLERIPPENRTPWNNITRGQFIKQWYDNGYSTPEGGWAAYDIHHILPREYGGTNDFWNLVPLLRDLHQFIVTPWWNLFEP
jgi:RHS repeat-associated protein